MQEQNTQGMICAEHQCRYNYKGDKNRVYQKIVAQIQMEPPGTPGVNEVIRDNPKHYQALESC